MSQRVGFVIHTAGPTWREYESELCTHMLVCTYINCFKYADEKLWVQSLATPLISAGNYDKTVFFLLENFMKIYLINITEKFLCLSVTLNKM